LAAHHCFRVAAVAVEEMSLAVLAVTVVVLQVIQV
jgi:hypothetical protein